MQRVNTRYRHDTAIAVLPTRHRRRANRSRPGGHHRPSRSGPSGRRNPLHRGTRELGRRKTLITRIAPVHVASWCPMGPEIPRLSARPALRIPRRRPCACRGRPKRRHIGHPRLGGATHVCHVRCWCRSPLRTVGQGALPPKQGDTEGQNPSENEYRVLIHRTSNRSLCGVSRKTGRGLMAWRRHEKTFRAGLSIRQCKSSPGAPIGRITRGISRAAIPRRLWQVVTRDPGVGIPTAR